MSMLAAVVGGFIGTLVLTTVTRLATEMRLTRVDLPFLLGTAFTTDRVRARAVGYGLHFVAGVAFAVLYFVVFASLDEAGWLLGALLGMVHALFAGTALVNVLLPLVHPRMGTIFSAADSAPLLEPPGFLLLNYGLRTPFVMVAAHVLYGAIVGEFVALS
jgi:hypothetical protein